MTILHCFLVSSLCFLFFVKTCGLQIDRTFINTCLCVTFSWTTNIKTCGKESGNCGWVIIPKIWNNNRWKITLRIPLYTTSEQYRWLCADFGNEFGYCILFIETLKLYIRLVYEFSHLLLRNRRMIAIAETDILNFRNVQPNHLRKIFQVATWFVRKKDYTESPVPVANRSVPKKSCVRAYFDSGINHHDESTINVVAFC